jgi:ribosomal protein S27AE
MAGNREESESYRLQMLRTLEKLDSGPPPPEVVEAEKTIAKYREKQAQACETISRLNSPLPDEDSCPRCWFMHGRRSSLDAIPHPDPDNSNRWKCSTCGYISDVSARP